MCVILYSCERFCTCDVQLMLSAEIIVKTSLINAVFVLSWFIWVVVEFYMLYHIVGVDKCYGCVATVYV